MPPLRQCGALRLPWRARPVPFCFHIFLGGAVHLAARLGLGVALASIRQLARQRLVHQRRIGFNFKNGLRQFDFAHRFAGHVLQRYFHCDYPFRACFTITRLPAAPGTRPRTANRLRSASTITTFKC